MGPQGETFQWSGTRNLPFSLHAWLRNLVLVVSDILKKPMNRPCGEFGRGLRIFYCVYLGIVMKNELLFSGLSSSKVKVITDIVR